jgi:hypothetical protein
MKTNLQSLRQSFRRSRVPLAWAAVVVVLDAALLTIVWHWLPAAQSSLKDALDVFGALTTAVSVVVGVFYFFWQHDVERRRQAATLVADAIAAIRDLPADLTFLANNLTPEQTADCIAGRPFALTEKQRPAFADILGADWSEASADPATPGRLRRKHVLALQGAALNYLNVLESALIARNEGLASAELVDRQFSGFYDAEPGRDHLFLGCFIVALRREAHGGTEDGALRDDDPFEALTRFGLELHARRNAASATVPTALSHPSHV